MQTSRRRTTVPPIVFIFIGLFLILGVPRLWNSLKTQPSLTALFEEANALQERISLGDRILIATDATPEKRLGTEAMAAGNHTQAIAHFQTSLQRYRNDPETLIYLNNARIDQTANQTPLKIAVSVPIGSNLNVAQEILRGVAQAQQEVNQSGGLNDQPLQVEIINDENDPDIVKQVATSLVNDPQVLAVIGHNASNASLTAAPIYQRGNLVMVSPTSFANQLSGFGSYIFRTVPPNPTMVEPLVTYVVKTAQHSKIAVCYDAQAPDNVSFKDEFIAALVAQGGTVIPIECDFSVPTFNANTAVTAAINQGADGLLLAPHIDRLDRAIAIAQANQGRLALVSSPTLYTMKTIQSGQANVDGLILPVIWHPQAFPGNPFTANARQLWGGLVNWRTATSYDATQAIVTGLQHQKTRDGLQQALRNPNFFAKGAGADIVFMPTGDRAGKPLLVQVQKHPRMGYSFAPVGGDRPK